MSALNNKAPATIFNDQDSNELKERQRLEELKRQAKVQQVKLDKRLNKQMIREYFAIHFPDFLTRKSDKELFKSMIESLGGDVGLGEEESPFVANAKENNQEAVDQNIGLENNQSRSSHQTQSDSMANYGEQDSLLDDNSYATGVNNPNYHGQ